MHDILKPTVIAIAPHLKTRWRGYRTSADRNRAIAMLSRRGYNYFVCYLDASPASFAKGQRCALHASVAGWVKHGSYICR